MKCCDDTGALRDENARLEERNAALEAVLRSLQSPGGHVASCVGAPDHMKEQGCIPNCLSVQRALSGAGKGWLSPDKVAEAKRQVSMIDASPAGSLNAQCKIAALDALKGE